MKKPRGGAEGGWKGRNEGPGKFRGMMEGRNGVDQSFRFVPLCRDASLRFMCLRVFVSSPKSPFLFYFMGMEEERRREILERNRYG